VLRHLQNVQLNFLDVLFNINVTMIIVRSFLAWLDFEIMSSAEFLILNHSCYGQKQNQKYVSVVVVKMNIFPTGKQKEKLISLI
jgi:hypothetical protein